MRTSFLHCCLLAGLTINATAAGWSQWRGALRDGVSTETGLLKSWPKDGPKLAWTIKGLGKGMASVSIADGKVFTMGNRGIQRGSPVSMNLTQP